LMPVLAQAAGMLRSLGRFVGMPTVVVLLLTGAAIMVLAATRDSQFAQVVAGFVAVLIVLGGIVVMFLVWLKEVNADIDSDRRELKAELDALVEDDEE